ncbi:unnamed protein product [Arctogadus glacialis]
MTAAASHAGRQPQMGMSGPSSSSCLFRWISHPHRDPHGGREWLFPPTSQLPTPSTGHAGLVVVVFSHSAQPCSSGKSSPLRHSTDS